jgi:TonB-linked SusC/RagA family outer membrane protein
MNGKLVGANIQANSGAPGGGVSVKLRGISSIVGTSEPLYVIDGIIVDNSQFNTGAGTRAFNGAVTNANAGSQDQATNRISDINPADIESLDVLKGPAAAAIYGTRANAGVIVITTKRGKAGKTKVSFSQDAGFSRALNLLPSEDWNEEKIKRFGGFYQVPNEAQALEIFRNAQGKTYDWDKEFFGETGRIFNSNLSVSGGNDKTRFYVGGGIGDETGIMKNTGFQRRSARFNIDHRLNDWIDFKVSTGYYNSASQRSFLGNDNNGVSIGYTIAYLPNFVDLIPRTENGRTVYPVLPGLVQNPFETRDRMENNESTNRFLNSSEVNFRLFQRERSSLKLSVRGGLDYLMARPRIYSPEDMQRWNNNPNAGASRYANNEAFLTYMQAFLSYNWKIGMVDMTTQLGQLKNSRETNENWIQGEQLLPGQRNPDQAGIIVADAFRSKYQDVATDVSQDFNWGDKIIGRVGVRFDRSSLNGDVDKYYYFPRASLAVNLTNFDALKDNRLFSQIKPRIAFGRTGGVATYGDRFTTLTQVVYGGQLGAVAPTTNGNNGLQPETAQEIEGGIDLGLWKNRLTVELTYYDKRIFDLLFPYTLSDGSGVASIARFPIGDMSNKGIELGLNYGVVKTKNFNWNTGLQFWNNRTKIERLDVPPAFVPTSGFGNFGRMRIENGLSPSMWWGRDAAGRSPVVFDADGKSYTADEARAAGSGVRFRDGQPRFQLSWTNNLSYRGLEFNMLWHTSQGNYLSTLTRELKDEGGTTADWSQDSGEKAADGSAIPYGQSSRLFGNTGYTTTSFVFDASYIRLREVSLYYTIPGVAKATKNAVGNIRIGVSALNPITISDILDVTYDPEASNFGNRALGFGVDLTPYPSAKKFFFHLMADF